MTPQELKAALESFYRDVARPLSAISAFRSGAVPVFKHHNARPPRKVRKHVHRNHIATWEDDWYNHAYQRVQYQSGQPLPDGA